MFIFFLTPGRRWLHTTITVVAPTRLQPPLEQFTSVMQEKFLSGQDSEHMDYPQIDNDEMLDDHWSREANYDAEDKYFNED
ncbi:unnamed protein product [Triticum turgidum subsp. durum]|uniref:CCD97-like C-terminal domain-containing protein n=1 Tax=Triticum turgidum subsp. durum TaxID=4567 RepID=A0A9R0Z1R0_TRITD|nr:unnamed protein product [Triticum turgidum subsp. durum]